VDSAAVGGDNRRGNAIAAVRLSLWDWYQQNREAIAPLLGPLGSIVVGFGTIAVGVLVAWAALRQARTATRQAQIATQVAEIANRQAEIASQRHEAHTKSDQQPRITESFSKATEQLASGLSRIFRGQHPQPARAAGLLPGSGGIPRLRRQPCLRVVLNKVTGRRRGFPPTPEGRSAKRPMAEQLGFEPLVPAENELLFLAGTGTPEWRRGRPRRRRLPGPGVRIVLAPPKSLFLRVNFCDGRPKRRFSSQGIPWVGLGW